MSAPLTASERNAVRDALKSCDEFIESIRVDYSGRGMYGRECFGIVTDDPFQVVGALSKNLAMDGFEDLAIDFYCHVCTDSMGMSKIIYFPEIEWGREEESEDVDSFLSEWEEDEEE